MDVNLAVGLIAGCPIFSQLHPDQQRALARSSSLVRYKAGQTIFAPQDIATQFFVIAEGEVLISRQEDEMRTRDIAQFIKGETFGEMDVLRSAARSVGAVAINDTTLLVVPGPPRTFSSILTDDPVLYAGVLRKLISYVADRIRSNNDLLGKNNAWIEEIRRQVYTDKLTGLYNTAFLKDALTTFPSASRTGGTSGTVLAFKPDRFKEVNDTFGHEVGDRAIQLLSRLFLETIAPIGSPIRYRGNEFLALLPEHTPDETLAIARTLLSGVHEIDLSDLTDGRPLQLTVSIGIAASPAPTPDEIVQAAYETMMRARADGGDRIYTTDTAAEEPR